MNDKNNKQFHDRDLYVFCMTTSDGKITTTANPKLIGTDVRTLKAGDDPSSDWEAAKWGQWLIDDFSLDIHVQLWMVVVTVVILL
jgi:hypothetical protein